jgi:serine/threonine-protein kinase RsbW
VTVTTSAPPDVSLRLPADSSYLSVLRTATAALAARMDFTLDDIEDLRIAVDEACAILLPQARDASDLACEAWLGDATITVRVTVESDRPAAPPENGFAWRVLTALTSNVAAELDEDRLSLTLSRKAELIA